MRGEQIARQWKIICLLEARKRGLTAAEISSSLDTHVRTICRDLEAIQEAGFPFYVAIRARIRRRAVNVEQGMDGI
jgi:predicted DNA-binding transcriptional regulator YafY